MQAPISSTAVPEPSDTLAMGIKPQPINLPANSWNRIDWQLGHGIYMTRKSNWPAGPTGNYTTRATFGEILSVYADGSVWGFADGRAAYKKLNGYASDGAAQGFIFRGYKEGAFGAVNNAFFDKGIVCTDWPWATGQTGVCTIPGE
jgi:hypothetical protein